jgi:hypothetical protein
VDKIVVVWERNGYDHSVSVAVPASSFGAGNPGRSQVRLECWSLFQSSASPHLVEPWIMLLIYWGQEAEEDRSSCGDLQEHYRTLRLKLRPDKVIRIWQRSRWFNYRRMSTFPLLK